MIIHFWGTRGSLPASLTATSVRKKITKALQTAMLEGLPDPDSTEFDEWIDKYLPFSVSGTYGMNTPCVQIQDDTLKNEYILCDAGTGLRDFAVKFMASPEASQPSTFHIFMSHLHWDHVQGFPFFLPIYSSKNRIVIHGYHKDIERIFREQMRPPVFPFNFADLPSKVEFDIKEPCEPFDVAGYHIKTIPQVHPGISYGYRFEKGGKVVVYSTDSEHKEIANMENYPFIDFFYEADLLIFDAQYSLLDATYFKEDWGHSSNIMAVELAARAKVKHLLLFHMEPTSSDEHLDDFIFDTKVYCNIYENEFKNKGLPFPSDISIAYDGLEVEL